MADKMLRIAGRGTDGTAKALKVDNNGRIELSSKSNNNRLQLVSEVSVIANSFVEYEVALGDASLINFDSFELSWYSVDGFGNEDTEVEVCYHRLTKNLTYNSLTFKKILTLGNGIEATDASTFCLNDSLSTVIKNSFLTIRFINKKNKNIGLYYPTLKLK